MSKLLKITLGVVILSSLGVAGDQFAMSDADRAMYAEMLDANPADMMVQDGKDLVGKLCGGDAGLAKFLHVSEEKLPAYIAGFPRYVPDLKKVVGIGQVIQAVMAEHGNKPFALKDSKMFNMISYVKSIANDEKNNIDINANQQMKDAYALGEKTFNTKRGGRGLSCNSCHSPDVIGSVLRTQPLPDLGVNNSGGTWPAYRMTKSSLSTMQHRFQGCMDNSLMAILPLGSPEMVGLEVYVTSKAKGKAVAIPGLKR
jgi:L-cysteine S-thiosulfotransferase